MEARVFVALSHPWICCKCRNCSEVISDCSTINFCYKCGEPITFNLFKLVLKHYDRCNLSREWKEINNL